ncbi:hypothetical protein L5515_001240 [Caenorhabditis briggsae]|uniref:C2H2-type domain-containing protein n=1 Tax=Caenorhabditis briggsae TaxID=6238 RepID=A0AAE9E2Y2_CAEBR|nr:hypothetical protein L5515_001240 [Caenorhabditis briggsae]
MMEPGPSNVKVSPRPLIEKEMRNFYSEMPDETMLAHFKAMFEEVSNRPELVEKNEKLRDLLNRETPPIEIYTPGDVVKLIDPKIEEREDEYLVLHEGSSGIQYNYEYDHYTWNMRFASEEASVKRVNELNEYGRKRRRQLELEEGEHTDELESEASEAPVLPVTRRRSTGNPKYWAKKKGGDAEVLCSCSICSEQFTALRALLDHRHQAHSEKDMRTCGTCNKEYTSRTHIHFHLTQEYKIHHCQKCDVSFASTWHLNRHDCKLKDSRKRKASADGVVMTENPMKEGGEFDDDVASEETEKKQGGTCEKCGKRYMHTGWLRKHQISCVKKEEEEEDEEEGEEEEQEKFKCEICLREYTSQFWFDTHKKKCTVATPQPLVALPDKPSARCDLCQKMFLNERSLEYHLRHCRARLRRQQEMPVLVARGEGGQEVGYSTRSRRQRGISPPPRIDVGEMSEGEEEGDVEQEEQEDVEEEEEEDKKPFQPPCSICGTICNSTGNLLTHRRRAHGIDAMLTCGLCNAKYNSMSSIARHINIEYSLYVCKKCGRSCQDSTLLRQHECNKAYKTWNCSIGNGPNLVGYASQLPAQPAIPSPPPSPPLSTRTHQESSLKCPHCPETFSTSFSLYNHRMSCDPRKTELSTSSSVQQPSSSSSVPRTRTDTIRTVDSIDEHQPIKCPECSKEFMYLSEITFHRHKTHGKKLYECIFCPKSFLILRTLKDHYNLETQRFKCSVCQKTFPRRYQMRYHEEQCKMTV